MVQRCSKETGNVKGNGTALRGQSSVPQVLLAALDAILELVHGTRIRDGATAMLG